MQRRTNIQISSLIISLSIITIIVQFAIYYFFASVYIILGISCLISLLCCHLLLEQTTTYEACFHFSLLTLFISLVIIILTYFGKGQSLLPFTNTLMGIALINWLIPTFHCFLRHMFEYGTKIDDFIPFYRNDTILFLIFYIGLIVYGAFESNAFPWAYLATPETINIIPFGLIATLIEDYLYELIPLSNIFTYLLFRILTFIPYGFYITLVLRHHSRLPRYFALLLLPLLIEVLQYFLVPGRCDIDDLIYALLGCILGTLLYYLTNSIFYLISGKDFLSSEAGSRFSNSSLHF